jgi:ABC-type branched-subunit amino acid transport system substrate-binding protein
VRRIVVALVFLIACHHTRKTLVPVEPQNGNAEARARFLEAKNKFLRDGQDGEFAKIVEQYPDDPIAPWAELYAGMAAVHGRDFAGADQQLTRVIAASPDPGLTARARLFLGIAKNYEGDTRGALELLAHADTAVEGEEERTEYLAAVAYAMAVERPLEALPVFDELYGRANVSPAEKALIVQRVEAVVAAADPTALEHTYNELQNRSGPSIAAVGSRLVLIDERAGRADRAAKLREDITRVRVQLGLPRAFSESEVGAASGGGGDPGLLGAVVGLGGKENRIAEAAVAGLALAAGALDGKGVAAVETRVAADDTVAAEAVDQLAKQNVIAIVGPIEKKAVDAAGKRADDLGVPLLSLSTTPEQRATGRFVFHIRHSPESRARLLAQRALAGGVKKFLILAPDSKYGKGIGDAFADAVQKGGGTIVSTKTYPADAKSYAWKPGELGETWDAVFVPDDAERLALVAPALGAAGYVAKPPGTKGNKKALGGKAVVLLSTADGLSGSFLAAAGRHAEGALLAPGYYPDDADPSGKPFIDRFVAAYGHVPGVTEAYAYDAAQLAAAGAAGGRNALAAALAGAQLAGVTGTIRFDADHRRADPGIVYTVTVETGDAYAIRALR